MKFANKALLAAVIAGSAVMAGCGSDSGSSAEETALTALVKRNPLTQATDSCESLGGIFEHKDATAEKAEVNECLLTGRITATGATLDKDTTYILSGMVKLGYGDVKLAKDSDVEWLNDHPVNLTIPAGTQIKGQAAAAFVVTRGAHLTAEGTAAAPVVFSSADEDMVNSGEWGGLVLQGFGITNQCPDTGLCNILGEGGVGYYGGDDNTDNSADLKYVVVTEGGYAVSPDNELNGVSFQGIGSGTSVDYLQVNDNADDGVEFWGGAVVVKHLVITDAEDDSIDWDQGFVGGVQYAIVRQNLAADAVANKLADKGIESDNDGDSMDNDPRSMPTIANVTFSLNAQTTGVLHREGTGAKVFNSIVFGAKKCYDIDDQATKDQIDTNLIHSNIIAKCTHASGDTDSAKDKDGIVIPSSVEEVEYAKTLLESSVSSINTAATGTLDADYTWSVDAEVTNKTFTAANSAITSESYVGAVDPAASSFWYAGWTVSNSVVLPN
ncbi:MAG: hypothetical protein H7A09_08225 [Oceanospirillaceae bacterium]|nr:hypothetical protein [Oceanospirillaceae bacterium]MCP5350172.1 hypothetical protein [Oceanospirillaceae bacterium]